MSTFFYVNTGWSEKCTLSSSVFKLKYHNALLATISHRLLLRFFAQDCKAKRLEWDLKLKKPSSHLLAINQENLVTNGKMLVTTWDNNKKLEIVTWLHSKNIIYLASSCLSK